jgi:hypothetical protein
LEKRKERKEGAIKVSYSTCNLFVVYLIRRAIFPVFFSKLFKIKTSGNLQQIWHSVLS